MGNYDRSEFTEQHKTMFVVAETEAQARARASRTVTHWDAPHRDDINEAGRAFCLNDAVATQRMYLHLNKCAEPRNMLVSCDYMPVRKNI
jgi:hypothetical protein